MCCGLEEGLGTPFTHQCPPSVPTRRKDAGQASALLSPRPSCAQPVALLLDLTGVTSEMMVTAGFALVVSISLLVPHHQAWMWPWTYTSRQGGHPAPLFPSLGPHWCLCPCPQPSRASEDHGDPREGPQAAETP